MTSPASATGAGLTVDGVRVCRAYTQVSPDEPCVRPLGHTGRHRDADGGTWDNHAIGVLMCGYCDRPLVSCVCHQPGPDCRPSNKDYYTPSLEMTGLTTLTPERVRELRNLGYARICQPERALVVALCDAWLVAQEKDNKGAARYAYLRGLAPTGDLVINARYKWSPEEFDSAIDAAMAIPNTREAER